MPAITQPRAYGAFTGQRYGSFAGRSASLPDHPVGRLTQPRAFGAFTGGRYGSFAGKGGVAASEPITQPRAYGAFTGRRYGSFAGRSAAPPSGHPVGRLTQPRAFGAFTGRRYGSFAGRIDSVPPPVVDEAGGGGDDERKRRNQLIGYPWAVRKAVEKATEELQAIAAEIKTAAPKDLRDITARYTAAFLALKAAQDEERLKLAELEAKKLALFLLTDDEMVAINVACIVLWR